MNKVNLYYPELDSLRFLAFLLVFIHHLPYSKSIPIWEILNNYGWIGVDLFLSLSSFLFAKLLFTEYQENGDINIGYFYVRRALRIWPLYFLVLGIVLLYTLLKFENHDDALLLRTLGMLTFTDNLFTMALGYNTALVYLAHLWTISYEEQFYLVIPWALRFFYRLKTSTVMQVLVLFTLLCMFIRALFIYFNVSHPAIWVFPLTHFESILGGLIIGLGYFDKSVKKVSSWIPFIFGLFLLGLVTLLPNVYATQWKLMLTYPLVGIGTSLILLAIMQGGLGSFSALMRNKLLRYLGKISYGLYVYHIIVISSVAKLLVESQERLIVYPIVVALVSLVMIILISTLSYEIIEKRFLQIKDRFTFIYSRPV